MQLNVQRYWQSRCPDYPLTPDIMISFYFSVKMFNTSHWNTPNQQHKGPESSGLQGQSAGNKQLSCEAGDEKTLQNSLSSVDHFEIVLFSPWPLSSFFILRHAGPPY